MVPSHAPARSRRDLLAMAAGGVLAFVATAIGRPVPARAADGESILVGGEHTSTSVTKITNSAPRDTTLPLEASSGVAIEGNSSSGIAIRGVSDYVGVWGESVTVIGVRGASTSGTGVTGSSNSGAGVSGVSTGLGSGAIGVGGQSPVVGVRGVSAPGVAVRGDSDSGFGLYGRAMSGTGVYATSSTGHALRTNGRLRFDKASGSARIAAGARSVVIKPGLELAATSKVLATLQGSAGGTTTVHRATVDATAGTITVYLTANATRAVRVAWLVFG